MIKVLGHPGILRRVAINVGAGFVPGTNAVVMGAAIAAGKLGWEMVGIRDGFEGLLHPDRYPDGGSVTLSPQLVENLDPATGGVLGQAPEADPIHISQKKGQAVDLSGEVLKRLKAEDLDALISVVGGRGLGILYKLHRQGLHTVCIPRSIENDVASTAVSFGFNSALSVTIEMLNKAFQAARSARKVAVVEVPGQETGWIALQAGIAARADAVLMPEVPCEPKLLAARLKDKITARRPYGLVVVAEGARFADNPDKPLRSGQAAEAVTKRLRPLLAAEIYPLVIGSWARGGHPTAVDQQLGMAYGAAAVEVLRSGQNGVMVAFVPPDIKLVPLADAMDKVRAVPADSRFLRIAQSLGIYLGTGL